jgi:hypothetical protein
VWQGYLLSSGRYTTLDVPSAGTGPNQGTFANDINERGQIVGQYIDANYGLHAFLLSGGQYTTIDDPAGIGTSAQGFNDVGQIVGDYIDANFATHGFLATPVHGNSPHGDAPQPGSGSVLPSSRATSPVLLAIATPLSATGMPGTSAGHALAAPSTEPMRVLVSLPSGARSNGDTTGRLDSGSSNVAGDQHAGVVEEIFSQVNALFEPLATL